MEPVVYEFEKIDFHKRNNYIFQIVNGRKLTDIRHRHNFYELIWFVRGKGIQQINDTEVFCEKDRVFLLRPGDEHFFISQSEDAVVVSLSVQKTEFEVFANLYHPQLPDDILKSEGTVCYAFLYAPLMDFGSGDNMRNITEYDCKFLLSCLIKNYIDDTNCMNENDDTPHMLSYAVEEMKKADHLRMGIPALVQLSHYSQSHLSRLVKKHYHMSLKQYINELRLQKAYSDMMLTDKTVQEIADELGFGSLSHFNKIFKERFSATPASLRKRKGMRTI